MQTMTALNISPDSFWAPSRITAGNALERISRLLASGTDIIDLGAVSTRPGADPVSPEEEWDRLYSVLAQLHIPGLKLSVDTTRSAIVRRVYDLFGPFMVNDISAGEDDPQMLSTVAELGLSYVAMHKRGTPKTMDSLCDYPEGVTQAVKDYFSEFSVKAEEAGVKDWILDPGFGFAKTDAQNMELLDRLSELKCFGRPVLVGIADKRFTRGRTAELQELAVRNGADILRVHPSF